MKTSTFQTHYFVITEVGVVIGSDMLLLNLITIDGNAKKPFEECLYKLRFFRDENELTNTLFEIMKKSAFQRLINNSLNIN